ncbi:MAG: UDP-3-O-[3-hydroxymyristoyl] N-acetylglucosamine deacetylase [Gemmatimonadota bacterium]|nr:MAG: UDP-3-O-[3-hydroxymyristoyl] N-acetylglucosamine deacetylase [Gemmatimonadota bacterium]
MRRSVAGTASVRGVGLHTGAESSVNFRSGEAGTGIVFRRTDLADTPVIRATAANATDVDRHTSLGSGAAVVHTVEHVLAAVAAHRLDDIMIDIDGPELPNGDGSAAAFFHALEDAGPVEQDGAPVDYKVQMPYVLNDGDSRYLVAPHDAVRLNVTIEWDHPAIGRQSGCFDISAEGFAESLARARTFGFTDEIDELRSRGLAQGATASSGIGLTRDGVQTELLWPDEFVRHKTVDLLGDLALLGGRFKGEVVANRPSHKGNLALVRSIQRVCSLRVPPVMGIQEILGVIPHRYPMLLVDRIIEMEEGRRVVGIKNVTVNEPFFQGHFPEHPIMPGVLIIEAMGQVGGMLLMGSFENPQDKVVYFMAIDSVKFRRPVVPGDQIRFELEMLHFRGRNCRMRGVGYVDGQPAAEAEMMARVVDK